MEGDTNRSLTTSDIADDMNLSNGMGVEVPWVGPIISNTRREFYLGKPIVKAGVVAQMELDLEPKEDLAVAHYLAVHRVSTAVGGPVHLGPSKSRPKGLAAGRRSMGLAHSKVIVAIEGVVAGARS